MRSLLDHGADTTLRNLQGQRAYDLVGNRAELKNLFFGGSVRFSGPGNSNISQSKVGQTEVSSVGKLSDVPTRLRLRGDPTIEYTRDKNGLVPQFVLRVWNSGNGEALDMRVSALTLDGKEYLLQGPATLGRNKEAVYSMVLEENLEKIAPTLKGKASCSNCLP